MPEQLPSRVAVLESRIGDIDDRTSGMDEKIDKILLQMAEDRGRDAAVTHGAKWVAGVIGAAVAAAVSGASHLTWPH